MLHTFPSLKIGGGLLSWCMVALLGSPSEALANTCDDAAQRAAVETGVPFAILATITRVETGRTRDGAFSPWPWTINTGGDGAYLSNNIQLLAAAQENLARGIKNFDLGCFQINYRWHGEQFSSLQAMIDPITNARFAAQLLLDHFAVTQDWEAAAGRYHSMTPEYSAKYREKFARVLNLLNIERPTTQSASVERENQFPLLIPGQSGTFAAGSLVPLTSSPTSQSLFGG